MPEPTADPDVQKFCDALMAARNVMGQSQRIGQIIVNATDGYPFYVEDKMLIDMIYAYIEKVKDIHGKH